MAKSLLTREKENSIGLWSQCNCLAAILLLGVALAACGSSGSAKSSDSMDLDASIAGMDPDAGTHEIGELAGGLSTLVGADESGLLDGSRDVSLFNNPVNVAIAPDGRILVADFDNGVIRVVTPAGESTTLVQQSGFSRPFGMLVTPDGEFYVQTDRNSLGEDLGALWQVSLETGVATLIRDNIGRTRGIGILGDGRLVLSNKFAHTLSVYDPVRDQLFPLAGRENSPGMAEGVGSAARFNEPLDVLVLDDFVLVADSANHRIRRVNLSGEVSTFAGAGSPGAGDGSAHEARFDTPAGLARAGDEIFVSEFHSGRIRMIVDQQVSTIAGSDPGFADHSDPLLGKLNVCEGIAYSSPFLYVADGNGGTDEGYHRVRRLQLGN